MQLMCTVYEAHLGVLEYRRRKSFIVIKCSVFQISFRSVRLNSPFGLISQREFTGIDKIFRMCAASRHHWVFLTLTSAVTVNDSSTAHIGVRFLTSPPSGAIVLVFSSQGIKTCDCFFLFFLCRQST